jgi:ubiquinone/menaquinone biosynthesis C-methylase UbiE
MTIPQEAEDVQSFERRSGTYENSFIFNLIFDWIHGIALGAVPLGIRPERILDIGCGTGRLLRKAALRWPAAKLGGVDPAAGMVTEARRLTPQADFQVSLAESIPLPDDSVDLVLSTMSFHHWQDQGQGVKQVGRVLHPGGIFVLLDICTPFWVRRIDPHGRQANPSTVSEMFTQAGLDVQAQRRVMGRFLLLTVGRRLEGEGLV